ncbi:hypothetical protein H9P43_009978 [Blastocladiella emersonii ATCC 22665]|nr:hypothetical protein H9P43_009978 [Blastocladiella emersonii ATCC 22665]
MTASVRSLLLAALVAVLAAQSSTALPQAAAPAAPAATATGTAAAPGASATGTPAIGAISDLFGGATLTPTCKKLYDDVVTPLLADTDCELTKLVTGKAVAAKDLEPQVTKLCSSACTTKAQNALKAISAQPECQSNSMFSTVAVGAFYQINLYCIKSPSGYCIVDQAKAAEAITPVMANATTGAAMGAGANATAAAAGASSTANWPKDLVCTDCTAKQYKLTKSLGSSDALTALSSRPNPAANATNLAAKCGADWVAAAEKQQLTLAVQMIAPNASTASGTTGSGPANAGKSAANGLNAGSGVVAVVVAAMVAMLA